MTGSQGECENHSKWLTESSPAESYRFGKCLICSNLAHSEHQAIHSFVRCFSRQTLVNPGSLGQPKTGKPNACYAVWENGQVSLRTYAYPVKRTAEKIRSMRIDKDIQEKLITVLESGGLTPVEDQTNV